MCFARRRKSKNICALTALGSGLYHEVGWEMSAYHVAGISRELSWAQVLSCFFFLFVLYYLNYSFVNDVEFSALHSTGHNSSGCSADKMLFFLRSDARAQHTHTHKKQKREKCDPCRELYCTVPQRER